VCIILDFVMSDLYFIGMLQSKALLRRECLNNWVNRRKGKMVSCIAVVVVWNIQKCVN